MEVVFCVFLSCISLFFNLGFVSYSFFRQIEDRIFQVPVVGRRTDKLVRSRNEWRASSLSSLWKNSDSDLRSGSLIFWIRDNFVHSVCEIREITSTSGEFPDFAEWGFHFSSMSYQPTDQFKLVFSNNFCIEKIPLIPQ